MNQRIQELVDKIWAEEYSTNPNTDKLLPAQLNKFAQLIVRECAGVCDLYAMPDGTSETAMILSAAIKRKFGVEE